MNWKANKQEDALIFPLLSVLQVKCVALGVFLTITGLIFFLPANPIPEGVVEWLYLRSINLVADAGYMAQLSNYPCAIAISYSFAVFFGFFLALMFSITKFPALSFSRLDDLRGIRRILFFAISVLFIVLPILHGLPVSDAHRTHGFFENVARSRGYIFIWIMAFMIVSFMSWVVVFFEISRIIKRNK